MKIDSIKSAEKILLKYVPKVSKYNGDNKSLDRMWPLLNALDNPQNKLKIVHVAGTSGKTSTSYFISSQLKNSGKKVGLTVSPHVDKITERLQINGKSISDKKFCEDLGVFLDLISEVKITPSYFELLVAFAYWVFERESVDYAVIETGVGGLLDGTNVVDRADKVCVITDIGFDHMHLLGSTLTEITQQKVGIIHNNNLVFMYKQSVEIMKQVEARVIKKNAILTKINYEDSLAKVSENIALLPNFQQRNWLLAEHTAKAIALRDNFSFNQIKHPENIIVPGRMDVRVLNDSSILIMDGAHNGQKITTFVESFINKYPNQKAVIMLALKEGKEYREVIDKLLPITDSFLLTTFNTSQNLPAVALKPDIVADYCNKLDVTNETTVDNRLATDILIQKSNNIKLIIGSFYLLGQVRRFL